MERTCTRDDKSLDNVLQVLVNGQEVQRYENDPQGNTPSTTPRSYKIHRRLHGLQSHHTHSSDLLLAVLGAYIELDKTGQTAHHTCQVCTIMIVLFTFFSGYIWPLPDWNLANIFLPNTRFCSRWLTLRLR